mgnify:CR=1 FL=1
MREYLSRLWTAPHLGGGKLRIAVALATQFSACTVGPNYVRPTVETPPAWRIDYPKAAEVVWTQEEPQNQGAWLSIQDALRGCLQPGQTLGYAGRAPMAAPAGGDHHKHLERTKKMLNDALTLKGAPAVAGSRPGHA